jgi:hypothetical protein
MLFFITVDQYFFYTGFLNSKGNSDTSFPNLQLHFISSSLMADFWTFFWQTFGLDGDRYEQFQQLHFISSSLMADFWTFFWQTFGLDGDR